MKYELVTDGQNWAVRKRSWFGWTYFCYVSELYWYYKDSAAFRYCWTDKETAEMWYKRYTA